jgi:prevent-host-death family protein
VLKSISASELRTQIKRVINEVSYGQTEYVVEKFGEPTAAIINIEDYRLLQEIKQQQSGQPANEDSFPVKLRAIHEALAASGYRLRTKEEIDAQLEAERASWES